MEAWSSLAVFALVSSITPGPNNMMLSASGAAFGFRRTLPHLFGVWIGFALLLALCASGVGGLIDRLPGMVTALKLAGSAYLLFLAWAMRGAFELEESARSGRPLRLHEALAFQFVNPKAWVMGITAASVFAPDLEPRWLAIATFCAVFLTVNLPCIGSWTVLGASIRPWLANAQKRRLLGATVAMLMAYSVIAIWL
jgi:threonine/homoserine/homoserine lactone efflux protein